MSENKEILIQDLGGLANFLIEFDEGQNFETRAEFSVFEVTSWIDDKPCDIELYLKGTIKWDGCSHIYFGDENGYLHLCGKFYFDQHKKVIDAIWDVCSKKIIGFNENVAS